MKVEPQAQTPAPPPRPSQPPKPAEQPPPKAVEPKAPAHLGRNLDVDG